MEKKLICVEMNFEINLQLIWCWSKFWNQFGIWSGIWNKCLENQFGFWNQFGNQFKNWFGIESEYLRNRFENRIKSEYLRM